MDTTTVPQAEQIQVVLDPTPVLAAHARHRRRFATEAQSFDEVTLATQSRCSRWTGADVLRHLCDVDSWMQALWSGGRPPFTDFDPIDTPHEFVVAARATPDVEVRDRFVESSESMAADVGTSGSERWGAKSVSPLGFVPWWMSALHVFWDSWIHERDVLLPLGLDVPVNADEAVPVLAYSLAIVGTLIREPTDITVAGVRLVTGDGPATATPLHTDTLDPQAGVIVDALAGRGEIQQTLVDVDHDIAHRLGALSRLFQPTS